MGYIDKKHVLKKLYQFQRRIKSNNGMIGTAPRFIDFCYDNKCNFKCQHCFTEAPNGINTMKNIPMELVRKIADEADELGFYEFDLQGGELLLNPDVLFELIETIDTSRFYTYLTTNGWFLDEKMAYMLAKAGVDRVSVSIDSMNKEEHDSFRGKKGAYDRAIKALEYVKEAGIEPFMNITVGHFNACSVELEEQLKYCYDRGFKAVLIAAAPVGCWNGNYEIMLNEEDSRHIQGLRKKYPNIIRDLWNHFERDKNEIIGCNAGNLLYITPWGDVLPCPFLHMKLGNIYESSLKEIVDYTFSKEQFSKYSSKCLAGEDVDFVKKYLSGDYSTKNPANIEEIFKN